MLKKLLKYDLKYSYKVLAIFYAITLAMAGLTRLLFTVDGGAIITFLGYISSGVTISLLFSTLINTLMRTWARFTNNLYKDESYLTHTLPITKNTIYLSKFISALITLATSVLVILAALFIAYYSKENIQILKMTLEGFASAYDSTALNILLTTALVFFLEMMALVMAGYTGLIIGHRSENGKMIKSVLIAVAFLVGCNLFILGIIALTGFFTEEIMDLFTSTLVPNVSIVKKVLIGAIVLYVVIIVFYYLLDIRLFEKGVNID